MMNDFQFVSLSLGIVVTAVLGIRNLLPILLDRRSELTLKRLLTSTVLFGMMFAFLTIVAYMSLFDSPILRVPLALITYGFGAGAALIAGIFAIQYLRKKLIRWIKQMGADDSN